MHHARFRRKRQALPSRADEREIIRVSLSKMTNIDFHNINRAAIAALHPILARLLPSGRPVAGEYVALNPTRSDRRPGSFKIKLTGARVGCWCDFATGDKGGDVISLVAYVEGISQGEAARMIARMLGLETGGPHYG